MLSGSVLGRKGQKFLRSSTPRLRGAAGNSQKCPLQTCCSLSRRPRHPCGAGTRCLACVLGARRNPLLRHGLARAEIWFFFGAGWCRRGEEEASSSVPGMAERRSRAPGFDYGAEGTRSSPGGEERGTGRSTRGTGGGTPASPHNSASRGAKFGLVSLFSQRGVLSGLEEQQGWDTEGILQAPKRFPARSTKRHGATRSEKVADSSSSHCAFTRTE